MVNLDKLTYAGNLASLKEVVNFPRYRVVKLNICDAEGVAKLFVEFQPDSIMHLAAESHADRSICDCAPKSAGI